MHVLQRNFLPEDVGPVLRDARMDAIVAVQAVQSDAETQFLIAQSAVNPSIKGVVGWVDLCAPDLATQLEQYRQCPVVKGFRHVAQSEPDDFLIRPQVVAGITQLGAYGFTYDLLIYPQQLSAAERLVASCPDVRFVLDHCAKPPISRRDLQHWQTGIVRLARHPNVTCKLSGLVTEASWTTWRHEDITPVLDVAISAFGAHRLMYGSDWPVCLLAGSYARVFDTVATWAECLAGADQVSVFGETARVVYRLEA